MTFNGHETYREYLMSQHWRMTRRSVLKEAGYICQKCCYAKATQVHHLDYSRLGCEYRSDLLAVCSECHKILHEEDLEFLRLTMDKAFEVAAMSDVKYEYRMVAMNRGLWLHKKLND